MVNPTIEDVFCLYLWRSVDAPGTLYLARGIQSARAVCAELIAAGYIVRVVQMVTNDEYELQDGALVACGDRSQRQPPRSHRMSQPVA
ncbi:MAG: hypothetical protein ABSE86_00305 [Bryobacteraceae bacterium]